MFSVASIGSPAVILPIIGILIISFFGAESSAISKALGLDGSLLIMPFFSNLFKGKLQGLVIDHDQVAANPPDYWRQGTPISNREPSRRTAPVRAAAPLEF